MGRMGWGREIRARVYLRREGSELTDERVKRLLGRKALLQVSAREIRAAYERREEVSLFDLAIPKSNAQHTTGMSLCRSCMLCASSPYGMTRISKRN